MSKNKTISKPSDGTVGSTEPKSRTIVSVGYVHYALFVAILAIRAFQPNSEPMTEWSVFSWFLMATPILFPLYLWVLAKIGYVITIGIIWTMDRFDDMVRHFKKGNR